MLEDPPPPTPKVVEEGHIDEVGESPSPRDLVGDGEEQGVGERVPVPTPPLPLLVPDTVMVVDMVGESVLSILRVPLGFEKLGVEVPLPPLPFPPPPSGVIEGVVVEQGELEMDGERVVEGEIEAEEVKDWEGVVDGDREDEGEGEGEEVGETVVQVDTLPLLLAPSDAVMEMVCVEDAVPPLPTTPTLEGETVREREKVGEMEDVLVPPTTPTPLIPEETVVV
jgi:hypothetical protein